MATKIYGASDDLIEFDGDVHGEIGCYGTYDREYGVLVMCSDGTILEVKYGKNDSAIWGINVRHAGPLLDRIELRYFDEDAKIHSDIAYFRDGLKFAYAATGDWENVK